MMTIFGLLYSGKVDMSILKPVILIVILVSILFFLLGLKSQKGSAPGLKDGRLSPCGSKPNCVSSEEGTQPEKQVKPFDASLAEVKKAILATGGTITSETDTYVSATYMSKIYKFVDDVELRLSGAGTVQVRSGSRVGYSDRGMNKKRVAAIRAALHK